MVLGLGSGSFNSNSNRAFNESIPSSSRVARLVYTPSPDAQHTLDALTSTTWRSFVVCKHRLCQDGSNILGLGLRPRTRSLVRAFDSVLLMSDSVRSPTFCLRLGPGKKNRRLSFLPLMSDSVRGPRRLIGHLVSDSVRSQSDLDPRLRRIMNRRSFMVLSCMFPHQTFFDQTFFDQPLLLTKPHKWLHLLNNLPLEATKQSSPELQLCICISLLPSYPGLLFNLPEGQLKLPLAPTHQSWLSLPLTCSLSPSAPTEMNCPILEYPENNRHSPCVADNLERLLQMEYWFS
ncbi:hypothetical protein LXL04_009343 [Taraxacum kok-saghyz]